MFRRFAIAVVAVLLTSRTGAGVDAGRAPAGVAQHLFYTATWNALPVARAELTIEPEVAGAGTARLAGRAETLPLIDLLWRMRDSFDATVATAPPAPRRYVLRQHENDRRATSSVVRDASGSRLLGTMERRGKPARTGATAASARVHDPASVAYLLRSLPAELADAPTFDVFIGTKTYRLTARAVADERITIAGRPWSARRLRLDLALVSVEEGGTSTSSPKVQTADVWISTGPEHVPLRLTSWTFWGLVRVELVAGGGMTTRASENDHGATTARAVAPWSADASVDDAVSPLCL